MITQKEGRDREKKQGDEFWLYPEPAMGERDGEREWERDGERETKNFNLSVIVFSFVMGHIK